MKAILSISVVLIAIAFSGCSNAQAEKIPNDNDEANGFALNVNEAKTPCLCKDAGLLQNNLGVISVDMVKTTDSASQNEVTVYKTSCRAYKKERTQSGEATSLVLCSEFQAL